jgi:glycine/D-amino acid oxidase-like deaminating enzyme
VKYTAEVAVVGGGVIGTAVAYYLSRQGADVLLLEQNELGSGTSSACDGFVIMQSKNPGVHLQLGLASARIYRDLTAELDWDLEYNPCGGLIVIERPDELPAMETFMHKQQAIGLDVRLISGEEARRLEPNLAPHVVGATYSAQDSQVNPLQVVLGFAQAAIRHGARVQQGTPVQSLVRKNGTIEKVVIPGGCVYAQSYILCTGVFTSALLAPLGLELPLRPRRGQLVVTEPAPSLVRHILLCARYIAAKYHPELLAAAEDDALRLGVGLALEQTAAGTILVGSTREFVDWDTSTTLEGVRTVLRHGARILPALDKLHVIRTFAGLRPYTPDGLPYLGLLPGVDNLYIAAGHEGDGIALAPITGQLLAELVVSGETSISLTEFAPDRFLQGKKQGGNPVISP